MIENNAVQALCMQRQYLGGRANEEQYKELFRSMSPVPTVYWSAPGQAPILCNRANFDGQLWAEEARSSREIVKGRFQGGNVGYIFAKELELFAGAYRKPPSSLSDGEWRVMELLEQEGPMTIGDMREITGLKAKEIAPILHKLQTKFLAYEDQIDSQWDRGWYPMAGEFPDYNFDRYTKEEAVQELLLRFAYLAVFFTADMAKNYYRFTQKEIKQGLDTLQKNHKLVEAALEGEKGYLLPEDVAYLEQNPGTSPQKEVYILDRNDFMVRSHPSLLQTWKQEGKDTLYLVLVDGAFRGAVMGKFHNGPYDMENIWLDLMPQDAEKRKEEILEAVQTQTGQPKKVENYCGTPVRY